MGTRYSSTTVSSYNSSPPADDGSTTAANKVTWATIKTKLGDPLNSWATALNSAVLNALDFSASAITGTYTTVASDNARVLQCAGTFTLSLGDAATLAAGWCTTVKVISGTVTIGRATGGNTLDGVAANIVLKAGQSATFAVNQTANGFNCISSNPVLTDTTDPTKQLSFSLSGLTTATTRTLTAQDASGSVALTSEFAYGALLGTSGRLLLPRNYIDGFMLTTASTTTYDIGAGSGADFTNAGNIIGSAISAKSQNSWVAGSSQGGKLSAAAMANNTWYYWYAIWKTVDGTVDYGFDVSTTPTLPSGYSLYRYIGARKTASGATTWDTFIQHGDDVFWSTPPALDQNGVGTTANRTMVTLNVPAVKVNWFGHARAIGGASAQLGIYFTDPAVADVAAQTTGGTPLSSIAASSPGTANVEAIGQVRCWTNTSSQVGVRVTNATPVIQIVTIGFTDPRGKSV